MALEFAYNYAYIDLETGLCLQVESTSMQLDTTEYPEAIEIPVYDEEYIFKYYINGNWYEDPEGTIPWTSSLL